MLVLSYPLCLRQHSAAEQLESPVRRGRSSANALPQKNLIRGRGEEVTALVLLHSLGLVAQPVSLRQVKEEEEEVGAEHRRKR